jgi:Ca-activated chloride channel family protein
MVAFNTVPIASEAPTTEHARIRAAIAGLQADGGTDTGDALTEAMKRLREPSRPGEQTPAAIVLLSDGKWTDGPDPVPIARQAGRQKIPIYTVALGTPGGLIPGGPFGVPLSVPPDPQSLQEISQASGGQAFAVQESGELTRVYQRLGSQVGTRKERHEVTASFAAAGLVLLLLAVVTSTRWRGRVA